MCRGGSGCSRNQGCLTAKNTVAHNVGRRSQRSHVHVCGYTLALAKGYRIGNAQFSVSSTVALRMGYLAANVGVGVRRAAAATAAVPAACAATATVPAATTATSIGAVVCVTALSKGTSLGCVARSTCISTGTLGSACSSIAILAVATPSLLTG